MSDSLAGINQVISQHKNFCIITCQDHDGNQLTLVVHLEVYV